MTLNSTMTTAWTRLLLLLICLVLENLSLVTALVETNYHSIKIVGIPGGGTQLLPKTYVNGFQRWQLDDKDNLTKQSDERSQAPVPTSSSLIRPTLDFLVKGGVPTYVMGGLQVRENADAVTSYPLLAQQWTTFSFAVEPNFRMAVYSGAADGTDDRLALVTSKEMDAIMERLGLFLSQATSADDFFDGFHILSVPVAAEWTPVQGKTTLTCVATAEPDSRELLTLDPDLVEMTASSVLVVEIGSGDSCSAEDQ